MAPEASAGGASLQLLDGRLRVQAHGQVHELGLGQIAVLADNLHEPIQAAERSAFLVTVAWPEGAGAWAQEEAAGRALEERSARTIRPLRAFGEQSGQM